MAVTKITYENKTAIQNDASVARKNKVVDEDMNEIKQVVNGNADELNTAQTNIKNLQSGQGASSTDISNLKNRVSTLETDNTKNKSDINTLKSDNQTNKSNISTIKGQISDIQQEQVTQNKDIENLQTNNTKQDELITKLQEDNQKYKNALLNAETEEAKSIHVEDANKFGQLEVLGNQEQETREGYNILDYLDYIVTSKNNLTIKKDEKTGYITVDGTPNADYTVILSETINITDLLEDKQTYTIFQENHSDNLDGKIYLQVTISDKDGSNPQYLNSSNKNRSFEVDKSLKQYHVKIQTGTITQAGTFSNYKNRYMVYKGTDSKEFELYGATPSPEYPSPVVCLGSNKNILNTSLMIETTKGGVTSKINSDGSITFNGTCTTNNNIFNFYIENTTNFMFDAIKNQTTISAFYVSGSITDSNNSGAYFRVNDKSYAGGYINLVNLPQQKQLTRIYNSTSGSVFCDIRFNNGVVLDNFTIKCKAANTLEDAFTYSPYGQGSTLISKINKNLAIAQNGIWYNYTNVSSDVQGYAYIARIKENSKITISKKNAGNRFVVFTSKEKIEVGAEMTQILVEQNTNRKEYAFDNVDGKWLFFGYYRGTDVEEAQLAGEEVQIELGNTATDYVEHEQTDYILNIQQEMLKGDYFIKESDGCKELHNWNKLILNGTETIERVGTSVSGKYRFAITVSGIQTGNFADTEIVDNLISNELTVVSNNITWNCAEDNVMHIRINNTPQIIIYIEKCSQMTVDEFKAFLQELYDEGKAIEIYYKLATPTKLPCTKEQSAVLEELSNMDLFEGVNNIITAEDIALLKLKYALDVKTYVDNKLNTINQQILEIAGGN